jgi:outer membrane protein
MLLSVVRPAAAGPAAPEPAPAPAPAAPTEAAPPPATPPAAVPDTAPADPSLPQGPLTLEEAIAIAYRNHGDITIAERNLSSARTQVTQARAGTRPDVAAGVTFSGRGVNDIGSAFGDVDRDSTFDQGPMPGLQLRYNPFDSGQTRTAVRGAQANVRGAAAGVANTRSVLAFDVTNNYFEQLRAQRLVELSQEQVRQAEEQLRFVEARIEVGSEADVSRYQVQVEAANARVTLLRNQNQVRQAGAALRATMGLPVGPPPLLAQVSQPQMAVPSLEEALAEARRNHPQLLQEQASVEAAQADLRLAGLRRRPVFSTTTQFNLNPRDERTKSDWNFVAGVSMPIWDAGVTRAREQEARYRLESTQAREEQTQIDISTSVQQAVLNIQNAAERLEASRVAVDSATRNLEAANERYRQGVVTVIDITTAQLNYFEAQNNAVQALYDYYIAQAQLQRAVGR